MSTLRIKSPSKILWILTLINFFNYFDRQVIFPLFSFLKKDFMLNDFQLGLLATVFMIVHSAASVPLGILADKKLRKNIITAGIFVWSLATFVSGLVQNFKQLLLARSFVGIGEASYGPAATSLLADKYPESRRGEINSIFNLGMFIGGTFGMMLAGILGTVLGWRWCFFIVGLPGLILAVLSWFIYEDKRLHSELLDLKKRTINSLFKIKPYVVTILAGIFLTFTSGAIISWITEFLVRYHNYKVAEASLYIGAIVLIAGVLGIYTGGYIADKLYNTYNMPRSFIIGLSFVITTPLLYFIINTNSKIVLIISLTFATLLMSMYYGPVIALIQDIVPKSLRATSYAIYIFFVHLLGDTISPSITGLISDYYNLRTALYLPMTTNLIGGLLFLYATKLMYGLNSKKTISYTLN